MKETTSRRKEYSKSSTSNSALSFLKKWSRTLPWSDDWNPVYSLSLTVTFTIVTTWSRYDMIWSILLWFHNMTMIKSLISIIQSLKSSRTKKLKLQLRYRVISSIGFCISSKTKSTKHPKKSWFYRIFTIGKYISSNIKRMWITFTPPSKPQSKKKRSTKKFRCRSR